MRIILLVCCFILTHLTVFGQEKRPIDKIKYHLNRASEYRNKDPKKRLWHGRKGLELSNNYQNEEGKAKSYGTLASYFHDQFIADSAHFYYKKSLKMFDRIGDQTGYAVSLLNYSSLIEMEGDLTKSFEYLVTADSLFKLEKNTKHLLATNVGIANILIRQKEFEKALYYLKKAEKNNDGDLEKMSVVYNNMIACYFNTDDFKNARVSANKTIEVQKQIGNQNGLSDAYINLASLIFSKEGANKEVIELLLKALKGYERMENKLGMIRSFNSLGQSYRLMKEYNLAKQYLNLAEMSCKEIDDKAIILSNKRELHKFYAEVKDWENAYTYYSEFKELEDSIESQTKMSVIQELQAKYDTQELKRENELAKVNEKLSKEKAMKSRNMSLLIIAVSSFSVLLILIVYIQFRQRKKKEVLKLQLETTEKQLEFEQQRRLSELKALQSQMNPHFLFNSLNSIQDLILQQDRRNSIDYLGKFSELTRKILEQSDHELISIEKEIEMITLYGNLEKLRFGEELTFIVHNELNSIQSKQCTIPSMFIQPYIENAFKHGLLHKEGEKILVVTFREDDTSVLCSIEDNGIGRERAKSIKNRSESAHLNFSTDANSKRIDLLNENQQNTIKVNIIDKMEKGSSTGTIVNIHFEIIQSRNT